LGSISQHVPFALFFSGVARSLRGARPHADERSEEVRQLLATSVTNSKVLDGNSVKHLPLVLQVLCGLELDEHLR